MKTQQLKRSKAVKGSAGSGARRIALLIGNARVRDAEGKGYALDLPGIDKDLAGLGEVSATGSTAASRS